jgi:hypothetical protein
MIVTLVALVTASCGNRDGTQAPTESEATGDDFCSWMEANRGRERDSIRNDPAELQDFVEGAEAVDPPAEIAQAWETLVEFFAENPDGLVDVGDEERLDELFEAADRIGAYGDDECEDLDLDTAAPWGEIDVCLLLPVDAVNEALPDADVSGTEATGQPPALEGCRWGDPSGAFVSVKLWDPVNPHEFRQVILESSEEHGQIAGHTAYVDGFGRFCSLDVDTTKYWVTVEVTASRASAGDADACTVADDLATIALSSLP